MSREVKVGLFVLTGMILSVLVVFLIGDERGMFKSSDPYTARFIDVQGLKRGSPVRMGGLDIGTVLEVGYPEDPADERAYVKITLHREQGARVREDSVATIENRGLLGDKMVVISAGDLKRSAVPAGGEIRSKDPEDLGELLKKVTSIGDKAEGVMTNLERTTSTLAEPKFQEDLKAGVSSLSGILESVDKGEGYIGKLLSDPAESAKLSRTLSNLERSTANLDRLLTGINQAVHRVNHGPGLAHEVVYGEGSAHTVAKFGDAAGEVALLLKGVREGNGFAHSLLYGGDESQGALANLDAMSADLRKIVADMRAGRGTLGALLVDPSVYEDVKMLLGNVQRNQSLRALVRYSIRQDEVKPSVTDPDGSKSTPKSTPAAGSKEAGPAERLPPAPPKAEAPTPSGPAVRPPRAERRSIP